MQELIREYKKKGFQPIGMMDTNADYNYKKDKDNELGKFMTETELEDPCHE